LQTHSKLRKGYVSEPVKTVALCCAAFCVSCVQLAKLHVIMYPWQPNPATVVQAVVHILAESPPQQQQQQQQQQQPLGGLLLQKQQLPICKRGRPRKKVS
jgi:hypothetical protein